MEWVAVAVNIAGDPAVHRMAVALRVRVPEVVGLLALTFAGMTQHAADGRVGEVPDTLLESWAQWHGKRGAFATHFRAELCDDGLVTAWEKYNGAPIRRAKASRERTRAWRDKREQKSPNEPPNANGTHTDTQTEGATVCGTGQNSTGPDRTGPTETSTPPAAGAFSESEQLLAAQCGEHYPAVSAFLDERPANLRAEWAKDLLGYIGPATGNLPEDLARAATDGKLAEPPVTNARTLRIFLRGCREERLQADRPPLSAGARALRASITSASSARGAANVEAGNLVAKIRELAFDQTIPGQGSRRMLRNADVERMGDDVSRAYRTVGGAARFLALEKKPEDVPFLINAFADALVAARSPEVRSA